VAGFCYDDSRLVAWWGAEMHKVTQSTTALGRVIDLTADAVIEVSSERLVESSSEFKTGGRVWVKWLNQVGVVQEVRRGSRGAVEYYLVRSGVEGAGPFSLLVSPSVVEKWLQP
jgi:hypothetical protein